MRRVISPGAIYMGGILITPLARDFERLDAKTVQDIYEEVSPEWKYGGEGDGCFEIALSCGFWLYAVQCSRNEGRSHHCPLIFECRLWGRPCTG